MKHFSGPEKKTKGIFLNPIGLIILIVSGLLIFRWFYRNTSLFFFDDYDAVFSLHLDTEDAVLVKGEKIKLKVIGINKRVSFSSSNFRVAGVNYNGWVRTYQTGKAIINAKVDGKVLKCRIRVIDLNKKKLTLDIGDTYNLNVKGITAFTSWKSSDPEIAEVSMFGKVTAKTEGTVIITAKVKGKTLECKINVEGVNTKN